jgi:hypothetical protein
MLMESIGSEAVATEKSSHITHSRIVSYEDDQIKEDVVGM